MDRLLLIALALGCLSLFLGFLSTKDLSRVEDFADHPTEAMLEEQQRNRQS